MYKNWLTSGVSSESEEERKQRKEEWREVKKKDETRKEESIDGVEGQCRDKQGEGKMVFLYRDKK